MKQSFFRKKWILLGVNILLLLLLALGLWRWYSLTHLLETQQAAERWAGEDTQTYAQASYFLPTGSAVTQEQIYDFRTLLEQEMVAAGLELPEEGSLYCDAWSSMGTLTLTGDSGTAEAKAIGVGGEWFLFHPISLRCGSYLSDTDLMHDRVLLNEELAFRLFGGLDVAGLEVIIDGKPYLVSGVIDMEDDRFTKLTLEETPIVFVYADQFPDQAITNYELVSVEPLSYFTTCALNELFPVKDGVVVDNSRRYEVKKIDDLIWKLGQRSIVADGVAYPYWENAARIIEVHLALLLVVIVALAILPVGSALVWVIRKIVVWRRAFLQQRREKDPAYEFRAED